MSPSMPTPVMGWSFTTLFPTMDKMMPDAVAKFGRRALVGLEHFLDQQVGPMHAPAPSLAYAVVKRKLPLDAASNIKENI